MSKSECPLYLHKGTGQWSKKVRGKTHYFGTDREEALKKWAKEKDCLLAGIKPKRQADSPTLAELGNVFLADCRNRLQSGTLGQRSVDEYRKSIQRLIDNLGRDIEPKYWTPIDFASIAEMFAQPVERKTPVRGGLKGPTVSRRSPVTVAGDIRRIRAFLCWCADSEFIPPPRFGRSFTPLNAKEARRLRAKKGRKDLEVDQLRKILDHCSPYFMPIVLLGINAAIGNRDASDMKLADYRGEWLDLPRGKTGAPRRVWLWPETRTAIDSYLRLRRNRGDKLFYTKFGTEWLRESDDAIGTAFTRARNEAGLPRGSFYDLRRTFATVAGETSDIMAIRLVMGHTSQSNDMTALYVQGVSDERVKRVCDHVRQWLFADDAEDAEDKSRKSI